MKIAANGKTLALLLGASLLAVSCASEAEARVVVGVGVGVPVYGAYPAYPYPAYPAYYPAYPYGYYPPAYPAPIPQAAPPAPPMQQSSDAGYCREYTHTVTVDGKPQHVHGDACRQPDGSWKIVD